SIAAQSCWRISYVASVRVDGLRRPTGPAIKSRRRPEIVQPADGHEPRAVCRESPLRRASVLSRGARASVIRPMLLRWYLDLSAPAPLGEVSWPSDSRQTSRLLRILSDRLKPGGLA